MNWSEADARIFDDVQRFGWHVLIVAGEPRFAYTIGLYARYKQPEVVVFGLRKEDLHAVCNTYGDRIKNGEPPAPEPYLETNSVLESVEPDLLDEYFGTGRWFYRGRDFPVLQLVWSDAGGLFPWDEGCDPVVVRAQPILRSRSRDVPYNDA